MEQMSMEAIHVGSRISSINGSMPKTPNRATETLKRYIRSEAACRELTAGRKAHRMTVA